MYTHATSYHSIKRYRNYMMTTKNGIRISMYDAYKLLDMSWFTWDDIFNITD